MSYSPDALKKLWGIVANKWDSSISYVAGAYVHSDGGFYKANKATTAGTWVASEWDSINIASQFGGGTVSGKLNSASAAQVFNPDTAYAVGDYVTYEDDLYQAKNAHPAGGAWVAADWIAKKVVNIFDEYAMSKSLCDVYDATVSYAKDDLAMYKGNLYKANKTTTGSWIAADWDITNAKTEFGAVIDNKTVIKDADGKLATSIGGYFETNTDTSNVTSVQNDTKPYISANLNFSAADNIKNAVRLINGAGAKVTLAYEDGTGSEVFTVMGPAGYNISEWGGEVIEQWWLGDTAEDFTGKCPDYDKTVLVYMISSMYTGFVVCHHPSTTRASYAIKADGSSIIFAHYTELEYAVPTTMQQPGGEPEPRKIEYYGNMDFTTFDKFKTAKGTMVKLALSDGTGYFIKYLGETAYDSVNNVYSAIFIDVDGSIATLKIDYGTEWRFTYEYPTAPASKPSFKLDGTEFVDYNITGKNYAQTDYIKIDNDTIVAELDNSTDTVKTLHAKSYIQVHSYNQMPKTPRTTIGPLYYAEEEYDDGTKVWPVGFYFWEAGMVTSTANDTPKNLTIFKLKPVPVAGLKYDESMTKNDETENYHAYGYIEVYELYEQSYDPIDYDWKQTIFKLMEPWTDTSKTPAVYYNAGYYVTAYNEDGDPYWEELRAQVATAQPELDADGCLPISSVGHVYEVDGKLVRAHKNNETTAKTVAYKFDDPTFEVQKALTALASTLGLTMTVTYDDATGAASYSFALNP